jgi:chromosome partitioning protein
MGIPYRMDGGILSWCDERTTSKRRYTLLVSLRNTGTPRHRDGMQVLSILARKGGVGKSLVARSLAIQALIDGRKAAILDADPQATIVSWGKRRQPSAPFILGLGNRSIRDALSEIEGRGGEFAVIDTPPHAQPIINIAAEAADASLVVTGPFPEDLEQVGAVISIVVRLAKPAGIVLNKTSPKATALSLARAALATFNLPTCPTAITQLVGHPYASAEGLSIQEREPSSRGTAEIAAVWEWAKAILTSPLHPTSTPSQHTTGTSSRRNTTIAA